MYNDRRFLTTTSFPLCSNYTQFSLLCQQREPTGQGGCCYLVGYPFLFFLPYFLVGLISTRTNSFFLLSPQVFPSGSRAATSSLLFLSSSWMFIRTVERIFKWRMTCPLVSYLANWWFKNIIGTFKLIVQTPLIFKYPWPRAESTDRRMLPYFFFWLPVLCGKDLTGDQTFCLSDVYS